MLQEYKLPEKFLVRTDFQMAGKGQSGNSWESEAGKNLLFSMALYPSQIAIEEQFIISQLVGVAIKKHWTNRLMVSVSNGPTIFTGTIKR